MDEKVLFNNTPQAPNDQQNQTAQSGTPVAQPNLDTPAGTDQPQAADQSTDPNQPAASEPIPDDESSPLGFLGGILGGGLLKKLLIGIGSVILLTVVIILLIPKGQPDKAVTLQWWGLWEDASTMQSLILDYHKTHPNVTITYIKSDPEQYLDRLQTHIQAGSGPDIFIFHNTWMPMLTGELSPLSTDVITPDQFKQYYYPVMQQDLSQNGAIYGIPLDADSLALFVNPELFQAAGVQVPTSWDDFVKAAKALTVKDPNGKIKTSGAALGTYDNINHAPDIVSLLFLQQGVQMNHFADSAKNESDALKFYTSFALGDQKIWDGTQDNSLLSFSKGNLAMYFGFSWDVFEIKKLNPNINFNIYPVPNLYGKKTTVASYWSYGVNAKSPNQKDAMEFMQYLAQKSTAQKFYSETAKVRAFGEPYARKDLQSSLKENQLVYPFVSQLDDAGSSFFASNTKDGDTGINSQMNNYLQTAVNAVLQDNGSADSSVEDLQNGVAEVLQKYGVQQ